jgi:hypothetical protein
MNYDKFIKKIEELGIPENKFLPEIFGEIIDDWEYTTKEVAKFTGKSEVTARRYLQSGEIIPQTIRPYICKGIDIKRKMFRDVYPSIKNRLKDLF